MPYAEHTKVPSERSKAEIEQMLQRHGASSFASGWQGEKATIVFTMKDRRYKFVLPVPGRHEDRFAVTDRGKVRSEQESYKLWDQVVRQRWRALALVIKAKLESVESGIATFEHEFMANIVMPDGETVATHAMGRIAEIYQTKKMQPLLPGW